ncbi:cytochrome b/b6 domain-containing protein [Methylobacter luteus]|uniref:cytochrome b/b6 domain-containing protein n=1 Tax=Methylobacter luteus TaxID=415 RepID=UPI00068860DD|nr:cytochrome b/b6 domain-containing protein [Methylobacter luteus]
MSELKCYGVWDAGIRWFHWINVLCVTALAVVGLVILNAGDLGVHNAGKVMLKTVHAWIGYVFALNLLWRIVWGFWGNRHARWRSILPGGRGYFQALRRYTAAFFSSQPEQYLGHNPIGRLSVIAMLLLMATQAVTGLVLAGTDLFQPPIGHWIAQWVAAPGVAPDSLAPYAPEMYGASAYEAMRAYRKPVAVVHLYTFYILAVIVILHVAAVIVTELREGGGIISAMFTGRKVISGCPVDEEPCKSDISS